MQLMLDIETLGTSPNAVIQSIAIQQFEITTGEMGQSIHIYLPLQEQLDEGRVVDANTLIWWSQQSLDAQIAVLKGRKFAEDNGFTLSDARQLVKVTLEGADELWANGPDFDCVLMQNFMGSDFKWPFWAHRDCRTIRSLFPEVPRTKPEVAHDALSDCHAQIKDVVACYAAL